MIIITNIFYLTLLLRQNSFIFETVGHTNEDTDYASAYSKKTTLVCRHTILRTVLVASLQMLLEQNTNNIIIL